MLFFLPISLMLRQQISRLIDEVKKLLRQVTLQHIQYTVDSLQQRAAVEWYQREGPEPLPLSAGRQPTHQ